MNREEHLKWCKKRALEYTESKDMWGSFVSDMSKHKELKNHIAIELGAMLFFTGNLNKVEEVKKFINDFN
jgi:hypothetical protein